MGVFANPLGDPGALVQQLPLLNLEVMPIDAVAARKAAPLPQITRTLGSGTLDTDQLVAVLIRILGL